MFRHAKLSQLFDINFLIILLWYYLQYNSHFTLLFGLYYFLTLHFVNLLDMWRVKWCPEWVVHCGHAVCIDVQITSMTQIPVFLPLKVTKFVSSSSWLWWLWIIAKFVWFQIQWWDNWRILFRLWSWKWIHYDFLN